MTDIKKPMSVKSPTLHVTIWFTVTVFAAIVVMACVFKIEVVARGQGKVVPVSRVQVVQPEFDGKVTAIHIQNGSRVTEGQVLVEFDTTDTDAELNTIVAEQDRLQTERARISTLLFGLDEGLIDDAVLIDRFSESTNVRSAFYDEQVRLLRSEVENFQASAAHLDAQVFSNRQSVAVARANIELIEAAIDIQAERLETAQDLLDRGISSRASFLDVQDAFTSLEKERLVFLRELDQKSSLEVALQAEWQSQIADQRNQLLQRRTEIEARSAELDQQERTAERRLSSTVLVAPMDGVVDQLDVFTIGAIATAGDQLLRVVPEDQNVEILATFANTDIGFVEIGQPANINLDAFPSERFGFVRGAVSDVAADSTEVVEGDWAFEVVIDILPHGQSSGAESIELKPGMTGTIDITTGERRLISYFFAPIVDVIQSALGER